jgi:hypothetical protein
VREPFGFFLVCVACGCLPLPAVAVALYARYERRGRPAWPRPGDEPAAFAGYRRARPPRPRPPKAPLDVRLAAFSCFAFGQMLWPGAVLGAVGVVANGSGVLALPGLWVAYGELCLGPALLERAPGVAPRARALARRACALNLVWLGVCAPALAAPSVRDVAAPALAYVLASLAQAALLFWVARRLERYS